MRLPCDFHDEADRHARILVGTAERIDDKQPLAAQLLNGKILDNRPGLLAHRMVVVLVLIGGPPDSILGVLIHHDILVFGGTSGVDAGHDIDRAKLGELALVISGKLRLHLFLIKELIRWVVDNFLDVVDAILAQIDVCH